jgi:hypothetical protein
LERDRWRAHAFLLVLNLISIAVKEFSRLSLPGGAHDEITNGAQAGLAAVLLGNRRRLWAKGCQRPLAKDGQGRASAGETIFGDVVKLFHMEALSNPAGWCTGREKSENPFFQK